MRLSARVDYAVRAAAELAAAPRWPVTARRIAHAQQIPRPFLDQILAQLREAGLVGSRRGSDGGYWLTRPAARITLADVVDVVERPPVYVRGGAHAYQGAARNLHQVWVILHDA